VDLAGGRVEVYEKPEGGAYGSKRLAGPGDTIELRADDRQILAVSGAELLP
jgi:hypothetical protein